MSFVEIDMQIYAGPYVKYIGIRSKMQNEAMTFVLTLHCDIASYRRWIGYSKLYTSTQAHGMEGHPLQGISCGSSKKPKNHERWAKYEMVEI